MSFPDSYYFGLFTSQYQASTKHLAWFGSVLSILDDAAACIDSINSAFDLDSAVGAQLDILGQIIGQGRTVGFQPSGGVSPVLDDTTYRTLLRARIAQNTWDGRIDSLQAIWQDLFPGGSIAINDNQDMTATILMSGAFTSITYDLISNGYIVPRPEGVLYNYTFATFPVFGFDTDGTYIAGFDHGHWS